MEDATPLTPPSTRLSGILLSVSQNPIFLKDQNMGVGESSTNSNQPNGSCCDL